MKFISGLIFLSSLFLSIVSCKNEPKTVAPSTNDATVTTKSSADVSSFEKLDHDFNIIPEGSRLFFKGFFNNSFVDAAMTINKGKLHVKNDVLSTAEFNLDLKTVELVANRNADIESFIKSDKAFNADKFPNGKMIITQCTKAINDQQATHLISGTIELNGHTVPFEKKRVRIDYSNKNISINPDQIILKASDFGIKMADPSQDNIYFVLALNGSLL